MHPSDRAGAHGLSQIGNHVPKPGGSERASDLPRPRSQTSSTGSETTGSPARAKAGSSSTGTPPSATGCARPPTTKAEAQAALAAAQGGEIDKALRAWLPPSIVSSIISITRWRETTGKGQHNEPFIAGYVLRFDFEETAARDALRLAELFNAPAAPSDCAMALGKLKAITISRNVTDEDLTVQIAAMAEELCPYPLDAVLDSCRAWARSEKFFPTWAELRVLCEERVLFRRALARALRSYIELVEQRETAAKALPPKEPQASTVWRAHQAKIKAEIGERSWNAWLSQATPHSDNGTTLILAVPTQTIGLTIRQKFGPVLERLLQRQIKFILTSYAGPAARERQGRAAA